MTDEEKIARTAALNARQRSLELLFDYTKFHIGVYLTLTSVFIAAASIKLDGQKLLDINGALLVLAVMSFLLAGLSGGVIASSITQTSARSSQEFLATEIGPEDVGCLQWSARAWTIIEHRSFWAGVAFAVFSFE